MLPPRAQPLALNHPPPATAAGQNLPPSMGYQGKLPRGVRAKQRTPLEEFEARFDEVLEEVAEREAHLQEMAGLGIGARQAEEMAARLRSEIAERVGQLRKLDMRIKELRAKEDTQQQ